MRSNSAPGMTRRGFLNVAGVAVGSATLAGCGQGQSQPSGGASGGDAASSTAFTFANWSGGTDPVFEDILSLYEQERSVEIDRQASVPFEDYQTRFRALLAGGTPPDVMRMNDDYIRELSNKDQLLDLTSYMEGLDPSEYLDAVWSFPAQPNGAHTGVAVGVQPRLFFYNKTMFEEAGVPLPPTTWTDEGWKWDDFLRTAQALTVPGERWGTLIYTDPGYENTFAVNNGGDGLYSEDGTLFALAEPEGVEAIQWIADLTLVHEVQPPWAQVQGDQADLQMFAAGEIGMLFSTTGTATYLQENVTDFEWDVAPVPGQVRQLQEGSLVVFVTPADSDQPDAAWDFLEFLSGPVAGRMFAEAAAFIPVNREGAEAITTTPGGPENIALFIEAAEHNQGVYFTSSTSQAVQIFRPQLDLVFTGEATAAQVLSDIRPQVEAVLQAGA